MIRPSEIEEKVFKKVPLGGYMPEDVDEFLNIIIQDYKKLYNDKNDLLKKIEVLVEKIEEYRKDEEYLKAAIITAQKSCDVANEKAREIISATETKAKEDAENIIRDAEEKAKKIVSEAEITSKIILEKANNAYDIEKAKIDKELKKQNDILEKTKAEVSAFKTKIFDLYKAQIELINEIPSFIVEENEPEVEIKKEAEKTELEMTAEIENVVDDEAVFAFDNDDFKTSELALESLKVASIEDEDASEKPKTKSKFDDLRFGSDYDINK